MTVLAHSEGNPSKNASEGIPSSSRLIIENNRINVARDFDHEPVCEALLMLKY